MSSPLLDERSAFLKAICDNPEDNTPRLIYADWLDEHDDTERAEFIRLQCEKAKLPWYSEGIEELKQKSEHLLKKNRGANLKKWSEGIRKVLGKEVFFERGFIEKAKLSLTQWKLHHETLFQFSHPIHKLEIPGNTISSLLDVNQIVSHSHFIRIHQLTCESIPFGNQLLEQIADSENANQLHSIEVVGTLLDDTGFKKYLDSVNIHKQRKLGLGWNYLTDESLYRFADSPKCATLFDLDISGNPSLSDRGMESLAKSKWLNQLEAICLGNPTITDKGIEYLINSSNFSRLRTFACYCSPFAERIGAVLGRAVCLFNLESLQINGSNEYNRGIGDEEISKIVNSPYLSNLKEILLDSNNITDKGGMAILESPIAPSLRSLLLSNNPITVKMKRLMKKRLTNCRIQFE